MFEEPFPLVAGRPGVAQGAYGQRGNLELVVPDAEHGLWVAWFNGDDNDQGEGAVIREWSGGLRFAHGDGYVSAAVSQVQAGDNALEVIALQHDLHARRWVWRAATGFAEANSPFSGPMHIAGAVREIEGQLIATGIDDRGAPAVAVAAIGDDYPSVAWQLTSGRAHAYVAEAQAAVSACRSSLDGGMTESIRREGGTLIHDRWLPDGELLSSKPVVSRVWTLPAGSSGVHRP